MIETVQTACGICHQISIGETPVPACIYVDHRNHEHADELFAAAKLFDAAPDLLAACEAFVTAYKKSLQLEKTDTALRMAEAAIERAMGND